jgi:hypothetical protein
VVRTLESRKIASEPKQEDLLTDAFSSPDFTDLYGPADMWDDEEDDEAPTLRIPTPRVA